MDIREKLARYFFYEKYPSSSDPLAYNFRWEDIPFDGCPSSQPFYKAADQVLALIKEAGWTPPEATKKLKEHIAKRTGQLLQMEEKAGNKLVAVQRLLENEGADWVDENFTVIEDLLKLLRE